MARRVRPEPGHALSIGKSHFLESDTKLIRRGINYGRRQQGHDRRYVYMSPVRDVARAFATRVEAFAGRGWLYRVTPVPASSLAIDPDMPTVGLACRRARVEEVVEKNVTMSEQEANEALGRYLKWTDGSPSYDAEGYLTPDPRWMGADPEQLRELGRWVSADRVAFNWITRRAILFSGDLKDLR